MKARRYSELECFVLGLVWQSGPSSAYAIRRRMQASPSTQWSASAGAIYPLMVRLHRQRLLKATDQSTGKRRRREYAITPAGLRVLRNWIGPPLGSEAITVAYDPLRSRARFLGVLTPLQRRQWLIAARDALREVEARVRAWEAEFGDGQGAELLTRSGEIDVESRRRWLAEVDKALA